MFLRLLRVSDELLCESNTAGQIKISAIIPTKDTHRISIQYLFGMAIAEGTNFKNVFVKLKNLYLGQKLKFDKKKWIFLK